MREQINAFYSRCDHQHPFCKSGIWGVPTVSQPETKNSIYNFQKKYTTDFLHRHPVNWGETSEAVIDGKVACKEPMTICWSAFSDEIGNFHLDTLMVYF